jgi:hypothetical protein
MRNNRNKKKNAMDTQNNLYARENDAVRAESEKSRRAVCHLRIPVYDTDGQHLRSVTLAEAVEMCENGTAYVYGDVVIDVCTDLYQDVAADCDEAAQE